MHGCWLDLGFIEYAPAFAVQEQIFTARLEGRLPPVLLLQENPPTYTIGRSGSRDNILAPAGELEKRGITVLEVNRGGDVTYHGPGQLIASPLLYLGDLDLNANQYLHRLEDLLISLLAGFEIRAGKKEGQPGVFVGLEKIAAVGIAVKHGYTFHGFSINVCLDLTPYDWINPCGYPRLPVTSMSEVLGRQVSMGQVKNGLRKIFLEELNLDLQEAAWPDLLRLYPKNQR
jgi:lipoate-protein ligase B